MPTPQKPLPPFWRHRPFLSAEAARFGVGANVVRHERFDRPFHGIRRLSEQPLKAAQHETAHSALVRDAQAFALSLRDGEAFSHETALVLLGCPIRHESGQFHLHVTSPWPRRARRATGVVGHVTRFSWRPVAGSRGLPVAPTHFALIQAAERLPLRELVVAIDHLVLPRGDPACWTPVLLDEAWQRLGSRGLAGIGKARTALALARIGSESRMETLLRLILEAHGLAKYFRLQHELSDDEGFVGRFDLVCEELKLIVEYDGEQHRTDRTQYLKDLRRLDRARAAGYLVLRFHVAEVLRTPRHVAARVAGALGVEIGPALELSHVLGSRIRRASRVADPVLSSQIGRSALWCVDSGRHLKGRRNEVALAARCFLSLVWKLPRNDSAKSLANDFMWEFGVKHGVARSAALNSATAPIPGRMYGN